MFVTLAGK